MKKVCLWTLVFAVGLLLSGCASTKKTVKTKQFKLDYEVPIHTGFSKVDLDEDLECLKYIITTSYAGYDKAVENGFDIDAAISEIREETLKNLNNLGMVDTKFYEQKIFDVFNRKMKLNDMHFSVNGYVVSTNRASKKLVFTDIYFEKIGDEYFVCQRDDEKIPLEVKFTGPEKNLYPAFLEDKEVYRYAVMANPSTQRLTLSLEGEQYPVAVVKTNKEDYFRYVNDNASVIETDDCIYLGLQSFMMDDVNSYYKFSQMCKNLVSENPEKNMIIDLRDNGGGYIHLSCQLAASVYFDTESENHMPCYDFLMKECNKFKQVVDSEIVRDLKERMKDQWKMLEERKEKNPYKQDVEWTKENADIAEKFEKEIEQHRSVYVLMNENTASASEFLIGLLSAFENTDITLLGNRTLGAVDYVGIRGYPLVKSGVRVRAGNRYGAPPCIAQNESFHGEGEGFWPDWWVDNKNILNTLIQLTGDESLNEKLAGLEKSQK